MKTYFIDAKNEFIIDVDVRELLVSNKQEK